MKIYRLEGLVVSGLVFLLFLFAAASSQAQGKVKIGGFEIDVRGEEPAVPQELQPPAEGRYKKWIVQFTGPIYQEEKEALSDIGADIGDYLPEFAFLVTMDNQTKKKVETLSFVNGVVRYKPAYKISPGLKDQSGAVKQDRETVRLWVRVDDLKNVGRVLSQVRKGAGKALEVSGNVLKVEVDPSDIAGIAQMEEALWIEEVVDLEIKNDTTRWVIQTNQNNETGIWDKGLHGEGQIVGIGDTGLDYDMPWFRDPSGKPIGAEHRKVLVYDKSYGDDYDADSPGHGTHVAGTLGGDRTPVDGESSANGMAPKSRFYIQDLSVGSTTTVNPPSDLGQMFAAPYQAGARIHSNSWGGGGSSYGTLAATADRFLWEHPDFLALFANGNSGPSGNTVINPATAKNVVSVGATLNGSGADNMASFSSNGLTADGRIKPTVAAPGDGATEGAGIISADSDGIKDSNNAGTIAMRGTSMATPAVAGAAALVRQYFVEGFYPGGSANPANAFIPSAALIKALLINSAQEMSGIYTDGPLPATGQGWGRVNLSNALAFAGDGKDLEVVDESSGLATGQVWSQQIFVAAGPPLKITLVWTDYPGAPGAGKALVNDLDLNVVGPDGTAYHGNAFANGQSLAGGDADRLNVEEQVLIDLPLSGLYEIRVAGYNVPNGPQPFALIVTGASGVTPKGVVSFDRRSYNGDAPIQIKVADKDLNLDDALTEEALVLVRSDTEPSGESVLLRETGPDSGLFAGSLELRVGGAVSGNGSLEIAGGDTVTATYEDADDGTGHPSTASASARIDLIPPSISAVTADAVGETSARITWQTDEPADSVLNYGKNVAAKSRESDPRLTQQHEINLSFLEEGKAYYFEVLSTDEAGNQSRDSNGGSLYSFATVNVPPTLSVFSSNGTKTYAATTLIHGTAEDPSGLASVKVNGAPALFGANFYELEVALAEGENTFTIVATDNAGNAQKETISVDRLPLPDLVMTEVAGPAEGFPGERITVSNTVANGNGEEVIFSFSVGIYLSTDAAITTSDLLLAARSLGGLAAGAANGANTTVVLPATLTPGSTYYLGAIADLYGQLPEADESNNALAADPLHAVTPPQYTISATAGAGGAVSPSGAVTVTAGTSITFQFTPDPGFRVAGVYVDGASVGARSTYTFNYIDANHTLEVSFVPDVYTLTGVAGPGGSISPAGAVTVPAGGSQAYIFTPDTGYRVQNVIVHNYIKGPLDSYTVTDVQFDQTIEVYFAPQLFTVTASATEGGIISLPGETQYLYGSSPMYTIRPDAGHHTVDVLVDSVSVGLVESYTFTGIAADHTIEAIFATNQTWTISASATGSGTVTPAGDTQVPEGLGQSYNFAPYAGWRIGSVMVDGVDKGVQTGWTFSNVTANHTLVVNFIPDTFTITATAGANGSIDPAGTIAVPRGGSQTYTITPAAGYRVYNVLVNSVSQGAIDSYTFSDVQSSQTISASFAPAIISVTASAGEGGSIAPTGTKQYSQGTSPTYYISPDADHSIADVLVDGISVGAVKKYTFTAINAPHTIEATFTAKPVWTITSSATGSGTVSPAGASSVVDGNYQKYAFSPDAGYRIGSVVVDGVNKGVLTSWTFNKVTADHTLVVNFIPDTFDITAEVTTAGGGISPAGITTVARGGSQSYTITPDPGYRVYVVYVNGYSKGAIDAYTFTDVQANQKISVKFAPN